MIFASSIPRRTPAFVIADWAWLRTVFRLTPWSSEISRLDNPLGAVGGLALPASADDPNTVGTISGTFFYDPPGNGLVTGEELNIADEVNSTGPYTLSTGETNTLRPGTDSGPTREPRLAVGFAPGATGFLTVDGAVRASPWKAAASA